MTPGIDWAAGSAWLAAALRKALHWQDGLIPLALLIVTAYTVTVGGTMLVFRAYAAPRPVHRPMVCLIAPHGIYHPYNRMGNGAWRMTLSFVPRCYR